MTEADWYKWNDWRRFLIFLRRKHKIARTKVGRRKLRLFGCACCRAVYWDVPVEDCFRQVVEAAEPFADGAIPRDELTAAVMHCPHLDNFRHAPPPIYYASWAMLSTGDESPRNSICATAFHRVIPHSQHEKENWQKVRGAAQKKRNKKLCDILRDMFGNPFVRVRLDPGWLKWKDGAVVKIAKTIDADRDYRSIGILGDAFEEAGCIEASILDHCRKPAEHVHGCWLIDLLLGWEYRS